MEALETTLFPEQHALNVSKLFNTFIPLTQWGKVDWNKIDRKIEVGYDPCNIIPSIEQLVGGSPDPCVFIEWSSASFPVIRANLIKVIDHFDDVTCVAHEKFILNFTQEYIIEILVSDEMIAGIVPGLHAAYDSLKESLRKRSIFL